MSGFNFPPHLSAFGRLLITRANAAATRTLLLLGDMATRNANALGALNVTDTTPSTSTTTGAITVAGGVGVAGALNVGGDITTTGTLTPDIINGAYIASNVYARTGVALRVPNERLAAGSLAYTVSGTATNPNNAFGGDYDDFATFTNGQTIEVDVRPLKGSNGFIYLAAGEVFALTFRAAGGVVPTSALIEVFDSTNNWLTLGTITNFSPRGGSGWLGLYRHAGGQFTFVKQVRLTIATPGNTLLAGFEWFPARSSASDMQQFVPAQSTGVVDVLAGGEFRVRASTANLNRATISANALSVVHAAGTTTIGPGTMSATNLPTYASAAAAAADAELLNGSFYTVAGGTLGRVKGGADELAKLRSDLEMIGIPLHDSGAEGVAALVVLPLPPEGQRYELLEVGFSYGGTGIPAGLFRITEDAGATVNHQDAVTSTGPGPITKNIRCGANKAVTITLTAQAGFTANVNGSYRLVEVV